MNSYYNDDVDAGYVKFTDNKIVKTEPITKNIYVNLDKDNKPVGVEVIDIKNDAGHCIIGKRMENSLANSNRVDSKNLSLINTQLN